MMQMRHERNLLVLQSVNIPVKPWEEGITVEVGQNVGEVDQVTPGMCQRFLCQMKIRSAQCKVHALYV